MSELDQSIAGNQADHFIATEVAIQDRMWGEANERADSTNNQLLHAAMAQLVLLNAKLQGETAEDALEIAKEFYPAGWDGFRDYGSNSANLVVAAAFLRSEIKRRVLLGEDTTRASRSQPYVTASPYVSSEEAAEGVRTVAHHPV